jgi:hypothetical protein
MTGPPITSPTVKNLPVVLEPLPAFHLVHQSFVVPSAIGDVSSAVREEWNALRSDQRRTLEGNVAVAVGSRGIDRIDEIVSAVVDQLKSAGCRPFIVPAMGSHGGGTAEGQVAVLESLGVSEEQVGAPIRATMDVARVGSSAGVPLYVDRTVPGADGIVLVNRIKPHTDFTGPLGSGLMKMLCVGLGKQVGAETYHGAAMNGDLGELIRVCGHALLDALPVRLGVAIVENQIHRVCDLRLLPGETIEEDELRLQERARHLLPTLPLDEIDLLIVDEMGKDISGAGMDPNVTGRTVGAWSVRRTTPRIRRIFARALSPASHGNACGLGYVDVTTPRLIEAVDLEATALNAVTSCAPEDARLPLTVATEKEAVAVALATVRPHTADDVRIVHIRNTSSLRRFIVSEACVPTLFGRKNIEIDDERLELGFDSQGRLISLLGDCERPA